MHRATRYIQLRAVSRATHLLVRGDTLLILYLRLDILNCVAGLDFDRDGFTCGVMWFRR